MVAGRLLSVAALLLLFAVGGVLGAFGQDASNPEGTVLGETGGPVTIEWDASGNLYRVEVRRDDRVFIETERTDSSLQLNLAPGFYEYRITVLNPFGKPVSASEWQPLTVHRARVPYFRVREPLVVWEGESSALFGIESANLREGTVFTLVGEDGETRIEASWTTVDGRDAVNAEIADLAPGSWDLEAADPSGRTFVHPDALTIRPTRPPEIESSGTSIIPNSGLVPVIIEGNAFDEEMEVVVKGPGGDLRVAAVNVESSRRATVYLDLNEAKPGDYSITVINPDGEESVDENAVTVVEAEELAREKDHPRLELQAGFSPMVIVTSDRVLPSFLGLEGAAAFHSGWTAPFLSGLGIEARGTIGMTGPWTDGIGAYAYGSLDLTGYWRPKVRGRCAPVVLLGVGNLWSGYAALSGYENILFIRTGLAMDFVRIRKLARIGVNFQVGFGEDEPIMMLSLMMRRGFRM